MKELEVRKAFRHGRQLRLFTDKGLLTAYVKGRRRRGKLMEMNICP